MIIVPADREGATNMHHNTVQGCESLVLDRMEMFLTTLELFLIICAAITRTEIWYMGQDIFHVI